MTDERELHRMNDRLLEAYETLDAENTGEAMMVFE